MSVQIRGLRELVKELERLGTSTEDLKGAFGRIGEIVAPEAARLAPKGVTGRLAGSVRPSKTKNKAVIRAGNAKVGYAKANNYGRYFPTTGTRVPGTKFLNTAMDNKRYEALLALDKELTKLIRKAGLS